MALQFKLMMMQAKLKRLIFWQQTYYFQRQSAIIHAKAVQDHFQIIVYLVGQMILICSCSQLHLEDRLVKQSVTPDIVQMEILIKYACHVMQLVKLAQTMDRQEIKPNAQLVLTKLNTFIQISKNAALSVKPVFINQQL